jgi:hypothetical protein
MLLKQRLLAGQKLIVLIYDPRKEIAKVRAKIIWEIQIDHQSGEVLHVAYRRSDIIEYMHLFARISITFILMAHIIVGREGRGRRKKR